MWYELWDGATGNRLGEYETERSALEAVAEDVRRYGHGSAAMAMVALFRRDPKGKRDALIAEGADLEALVVARITASHESSKSARR